MLRVRPKDQLTSARQNDPQKLCNKIEDVPLLLIAVNLEAELQGYIADPGGPGRSSFDPKGYPKSVKRAPTRKGVPAGCWE